MTKLAKASRTPAPTDPNPRAVPGNNSDASPTATEEAQLLSFVGRIRAQQPETAKAKAILDAEKAKETEIFRLAKAAGFSRKELDEYLDDIKEDSRVVEENEDQRARRRGMLSLPTGPKKKQGELELNKEPRDGMWWQGEGYRAALRGSPAVVPDDCPPEFRPNFLEGWHAAAERSRWANERTGVEAPPEPSLEERAAELEKAREDDEDEAV